MPAEVVIRGRRPSKVILDRPYQSPGYWDKNTPLIPGNGFPQFLSFYADLVDNQLRRRLAKEDGFKLDVGCGEGRLLDCASLGVDFSPGMLKRAKTKGRGLVRASITDLPFRDSVFEFAYSVDTFQHLTSAGRLKVMEEISRVSKAGPIYWARISFSALPRPGRVSTPAVFLLSFFIDRMTIRRVLRNRTSLEVPTVSPGS